MTSAYMTDLSLDVAENTVIGSDGTAWIRHIGPVLSWERWTLASIQTWSNSDDETKLYVYRGNKLMQGTYSGNFDTSDVNMTLMQGDQLSFMYENGTPGALCTITLEGRRKLRGRLAY